MAGLWSQLSGWLGQALDYCSSHTGLPWVVLAAVVLVASLRLVRRVAAVLLEIGLVVAVLSLCTKLGWITW